MRLLASIFVTWFLIAVWPTSPPTPPSAGYEEKVWLSHTCTGSRWYLEESDEQTATLGCYAPDAEDK